MFQQIQQGTFYFKEGWRLFFQKGLRRFVIVPLLVNASVMVWLFWFFLHQLTELEQRLAEWLPTAINEVAGWVLLALLALSFLAGFYFFFNTLSGFIAAPFNGLLAEKVEQRLTGHIRPDEGLSQVFKDIPRILKREWTKLCYTFPRLILLFILSFIPVFGQTIVPCFVFLFSAWVQAIQYEDYPFDNHKVSFIEMKYTLKKKPWLNLTFGILVMICTFIPFINFLILPVATCGATAMWVDQYRKDFFKPKSSAPIIE